MHVITPPPFPQTHTHLNPLPFPPTPTESGGINDEFAMTRDILQRARLLDPEAALAWDKDDDTLLLSIIHEFGQNWRLVADIFAVACKLSGVHRNAEMCKNRFHVLAVSPPPPNPPSPAL